MESRPVFADPSGRRHQVLRFAGFGTMAVIAVCLGALIVAVSGGPKAPFTQWAAPQPPSSSAPGHGSHPLGGGKSSPGNTAPGPRPGSSASGGPGPGQLPRAGATPATSSGKAKTSPPAPKASATHGKSDGHSRRPSPSSTPKA